VNEHQICTRCVMDTTDPDIRFDEKGVCSHCHKADLVLPQYRFTPEESRRRLDKIATSLKKNGRGKPYDCVLGMSGGVDSSYAAHIAGQLGLRVLVVHFDNGWNSEVAVSNIKKIVAKCGFELYTYVINWPEFRDLQRAFIKASVVDIEMVTDHAIFAAMFRLARERGLHYVLSGTNYATEHGMPPSWLWRKQDLVNLKAIHRRFGTMKLKTFPILSSFHWGLYVKLGFGLKYVEILNNLNYRKTAAIETLEQQYGWRYYGGKHYESIFTKFYQAYILPVKFGIDKRKVHYSDLIRNGEMTREQVLAELAKPLYLPVELRADREYVLKKLGISNGEFEDIMRAKAVPLAVYGTDEKFVFFGKKLFTWYRENVSST
jgi:N-acetyl sugar amidotransferase